jgi:hypothetical protein
VRSRSRLEGTAHSSFELLSSSVLRHSPARGVGYAHDRTPEAPVSDELFPSGPWTGFYTYQPGDKHRMDLHLTFANGTMRGDGNDDIGRFLIDGHYAAQSCECHWTKTYPGSHSVFYHGYREGKGIWGRWEIGAFSRGGFHIWPRGASEGEAEALTGERHEIADAIAAPPDLQPVGAPK